MAETAVWKKRRATIDSMDVGLGKRTRLIRLLYEHGMKNGTLLLLPIDQGLEHGPIDFFSNPAAADPDYECRLALEGGYSGIVFHVGLAKKYMRNYAGRVPLVLKINGKTTIPSDAEAFSPLDASVEDAVALGADAVGYTLYVGSPAQDRDFLQFEQVRRDCDRYQMPLIVWSYPRGAAIEAKGGRDSIYAVDYAARVACELGADIVKLNVPEYDAAKAVNCPKPYDKLALSYAEGVAKVVESAGRTMVLFSGGSKLGDEDLLDKARICMEEGATGLIFGRNMWQRPLSDGLAMTARVKEIMSKFGL
ncbi:MAG: class I fructose-bisphosphate aldolase [Anaerolineae bacterium]